MRKAWRPLLFAADELAERVPSLASTSCIPSAPPDTFCRGNKKTSQVLASDVRACLEVFDTAEPGCPSPVAVPPMLTSTAMTVSALRTEITTLNALPTRAAGNASQDNLTAPAHDSRRRMIWLILCFRRLSLPVLRQLSWLFHCSSTLLEMPAQAGPVQKTRHEEFRLPTPDSVEQDRTTSEPAVEVRVVLAERAQPD